MLSAGEIQRVYASLYILHPDEQTAERMTYDVCDRFLAYQGTRITTPRPRSERAYTVPLSGKRFLQACVFSVSEQWELAQEGQRPHPGGELYHPTPDDLLVRYVKLLIWRTFNRRVEHLAVGLGCHLYQYLPEHMSRVAPAVVSYANLRRINGYRLDEIQERFPALACVTVPPYQAHKVCTRKPTAPERALILKAFAAFTPRFTPHKRPSESVLQLFDDSNPALDWKQKHALIDVECAGLETLIRAYNRAVPESTMRLDDPEENLDIPAFPPAGNANHSNHHTTSGGNRFSAKPLSRAAIRVLTYALEQTRRRRRHHRAGPLRVHVDGTECAQLAPGTRACEPFQVPLRASVVEVYGHDEDGALLLAALPLPPLESLDDPVRLVVTHEGGQTLEFVLQPVRGDTGEVLAGRVHVTYLEAPRGRAAGLWERVQPLWESFCQLGLAARRRPVLAGALLLVLCYSLVFFWVGQQERHLAFHGAPQGDCSKAQTYITQAVQLRSHPAEREALIERERLYRQALALCPNHAEARNNLGHVYEQLGQYAEAVKQYMQAKELNSAVPSPYFGLGDVHFKRGDYQEAIQWYKAGLALDPTDKVAQLLRMQAEALLQRSAIPATQIAQVLAFSPPGTRGAGDVVQITFSTALVPFDSVTNAIQAEGKAQLNELGKALASPELSPYVFEISGYTDRRGPAAEQRALSLQRAEAVKNYLMTQFHIPGERLQAQGYGTDHLIAQGLDEGSHAINNRVEVVRVGQARP